MTIDEAIVYEINIISSRRKHAENHCVTQEFFADIDYHEQLALWLKELKEARKGFEENRKAGYKHGYSDGYNKAIDDFAKECKDFMSFDCESGRFHIHIDEEEFEELVKQLRGGADDE